MPNPHFTRKPVGTGVGSPLRNEYHNSPSPVVGDIFTDEWSGYGGQRLPYVHGNGRQREYLRELNNEQAKLYNSALPIGNSYLNSLPTEEERLTLPRVPAKIPWKVYTIAFIELVERISYYGTVAVFSNFVRSPNPGTPTGRPIDPDAAEAQPGALGMGKIAAQGINNFNLFWIYFLPLIGAYIADTWLGRFKTICWAVLIAEIGHVVLTVSAIPPLLQVPKVSFGVFIIGIITMGIGTGAFKPNISPLIAEQIPTDVMRVEERKGKRVIVDPAATTARIYNYFYLCINIGALTGQISMVYAERYHGFYLAYLIPTACFLTTAPVLFFCRNRYLKRRPEGSVLGPAVKLLLLALKGRWHLNPIATWKHWHDGTFWLHVKPSYMGGYKPSWMTFDDAWVDEVARGWAACGVFLWYPLYWITYNQVNNNLIAQAADMTLHGVPNDIIANLDPLAIMILVPIFDLLLYPLLRKLGIQFTPIKKIAGGFFLGTAAMAWAAVVQYYIYKTSPCGDHASEQCKSPINVWAQTGAYILIAASEILAAVSTLEYAFTKAPKNMRSFVQAFHLFMSAFSAAIGQAFLPLSENPHLVWNYGAAGIIAFVAGCIFWLQFRHLDEQEDELNMLPAGKFEKRNEGEHEFANGHMNGSEKGPNNMI